MNPITTVTDATAFIEDNFRAWLHEGLPMRSICHVLPASDRPSYESLAHFVGTHATRTGLQAEIPFRDFLNKMSQLPGSTGTIADGLSDLLGSMRGCILEMVKERVFADPGTRGDEIFSAVSEKLADLSRADLSALLMKVLLREVGDLPLREIFLRRRHQSGFASWSADNATLLTTAKRVGRVGESSLYLKCDPGWNDGRVRWAEFVAGVRATGGPWEAVAAGVVYRFGKGVSDRPEELIWAGDEISSGDMSRASFFVDSLGSREAARQVLARGDVIVLWQWERRHGAAKGRGVELLDGVCSHLQRRYPRLTHLVIPVSAQRFVPRAPDEPVLITAARKAEILKGMKLVEGLGARLGFTVYAIHETDHDSPRNDQ